MVLHGRISSGIVGSVVECSPATRAARVRFLDDATFLWCFHVKCDKKNSGDAGYRSPYLSHAKRALYHLSYVPKLVNARQQVLCVSGSLGMGQIPAIFIQHVLAFDSSVGRAVDCSCSKSDIHRSLVQIRLEGVFANSLG